MMEKVKNIVKSNWLVVIGVVVGLIGGFCYWKFVGCSTGTCPITGNPYASTLYGGLLGGLFFSMFKSKK